MPELPEVETIRQLLKARFAGKTIHRVEAFADPLVFRGILPDVFLDVLGGAKVSGVGRKGKHWWLDLENRPSLMGHLGMSGWITEVPQSASEWPTYTRLVLGADDGRIIAFTDPRRFGRIWLSEDPKSDPRIVALGPDAWEELPSASELASQLTRRSAPIKGVLLDQRLFAGVGNWVADEALYQAQINPWRPASSLTSEQVTVLRDSLWAILETAVSVQADKRRFPDTWLFHVRWHRGKTALTIDGREIKRETIAGRTCAWVPTLQI
jgi:formamidopyrimidine-DNA glycosylase